jgi:putative zinc-dependent peptidase DUF5700
MLTPRRTPTLVIRSARWVRTYGLAVVAMLAARRLQGQQAPGTRGPGSERSGTASSSAARPDVTIARVANARLRIVSDEADNALALATARDSQQVDRSWKDLRGSEGYWALHLREAAMHGAFTDSSFLAFLRSDSMAARASAVRATLERWRGAGLSAAVRRAAAYLPPGTPFHATLYFEVKPRPNTFVFTTDSGPSIFVAVDTTVTAPALENELAHELHHIGYNAACASRMDTSQAEPLKTVAHWMGAFGEGWAMLAAAGGPNVHPHATSDSAGRAVWDHDYANMSGDMRQLDRFFMNVFNRRLTPDSIDATAMSFFGTVQGPWYTVGYLMTRTVEVTDGHGRLLDLLCDPPGLVLTYQRIAGARDARGGNLPLWSDALIGRLRQRSAGGTTR